MSAETDSTTQARVPKHASTHAPANHQRATRMRVAKCILGALALLCVTMMGIEQVQLYIALGKETQKLNTYREHLAPVSQWATETGMSAIGYLQSAPTPQADGAKKVMTQYLVAPLILRPPERGVLLVNFSNQSQQEAFEKAQNCHVAHQFRPGLALMEKNP